MSMSISRVLFDENPTPSARRRHISRISVKGLFGQFDYELPKFGQGADFSKFILLYGDNGTGKTTILNILFHLLSAAPNRGHRNALAEIRFRTFEVDFSDGTRVGAYRTEDTTGKYELTVGFEKEKFSVTFDPDARAQGGKFGSPDDEARFITFLQTLEETLYILPTHRIIVSDRLPRFGTDDIEPLAYSDDSITSRSRMERYLNLGYEFRSRSLSFAMNLAAEWIRRKAFLATNQGTDDANTIYADVLKRITVTQSLNQRELLPTHYTDLSATLDRLARRSAEFARFKFMRPLQIDALTDVLARPVDSSAPLVESVLQSYIEGTTARLNALDSLYKVTTSFINNLNHFFRWKKVRFDLQDGLSVLTDKGDAIRPTALSSGEQHLLLMFCHTLSLRDRQSILIIDEPELSLNVKWQRSLIDALLDISQGSPVQFVLATHALEIVHEHMECVGELEPTIRLDSESIKLRELSGPPTDPGTYS